MAQDADTGDKTEQPTPRRLADARKKGDVAKSKDIGPALTTLAFLAVVALGGGTIAALVAETATTSLDQLDHIGRSAVDAGVEADHYGRALVTAARDWSGVFLLISAMIVVPLALAGFLAEFLQVGPLVTGEKLKPKPDAMNPVEGLKRMFGKDGLVELVKALVKVTLLGVVVVLVVRASLPMIGETGPGLLIGSDPSPTTGGGAASGVFLEVTRDLTIRLLAWVAVLFAAVAAVDWLWSRHRFLKKMRMSMRDIRQEHKQDEGDPMIKGSRRQMHEEWANQNAVGAAGEAAALLVNPTHLAIALDYDEDRCPVPVIAARGAGPLAAAMRAEATRRGVPIVRHVPAARRLWARGEVGEIVPEELFDVIAEVILWARRARDGDAPMDQDIDAGDVPTRRPDKRSPDRFEGDATIGG